MITQYVQYLPNGKAYELGTHADRAQTDHEDPHPIQAP